MQLIVNAESTDTEKMSTIEQESLIEKPFVNGTQEINEVVKAIDDQEIPIANKENIQIKQYKINADENRNPEQIQEVGEEGKIIVNTKEAKISIDNAAVANEECKQLIDGTEPDCPVIKNGTGNVTHEIDENKSHNNSIEENEVSKNIDIKYGPKNNADNETITDGDTNDDDSINKVIKPVKDIQSHEETKNDSLKEIEKIENVDLDQKTQVAVSKIKETLQENSHETTVPVHDSVKAVESETIAHNETSESSEAILDLDVEFPSACLNHEDSVSEEIPQTSPISEDVVHCIMESENTTTITGEPEVDVAAVSDELKKDNNENTEIVNEMLKHGDVTEVISLEKNNSPQLAEDVEMVSTECKMNDITDVNTEENNKCAQMAEETEMVSLEDKNKEHTDIQGVNKMEISENIDKATVESSNNIEIDVEKRNKNDSCNKDGNASIVNDIVDLDEIKIVEDDHKKDPSDKNDKNKISSLAPKVEEKKICTTTIRLSNTLDILSDDDDEEPVKTTSPEPVKVNIQKVASPDVSEKCINLDDDDDIMLIDDVTSTTDVQGTPKVTVESGKLDFDAEPVNSNEIGDIKPETSSDLDPVIPEKSTSPKPKIDQIADETPELTTEKPKPLIPDNFFKTFKKNLADMTRDDLEEFCILKIVESIIERSNLNDIKSKLKAMALGIDEYKKKAMMLTKQNRDLQVVLKSIQEELKKKSGTAITPLKITRSVGMQVVMPDKNRRKALGQNTGVSPNTNALTNVNNNTNRPQRNSNQNQRLQKPANTSQNIPVPRLVPATNTNVTNKPAQTTTTTNNAKAATALPNGAKNSPATQKTAEKRTHKSVQSVTVDLTDDEPPAKQTPKNSPVPPVRLVPSQNLLSARQQFSQTSPRKVYIPISGQNIKPQQTVLITPVPTPRPTRPPMVRLPQSSVRSGRAPNSNRHPAPLPDAMKQYQPPNWKALPPAPDLKLSKVENGIVISWKIDGYQDDSYEEIASYQLYAYQETSTPPNTALWKKIGDVKALPLPMACTLTQFMAGYKYYFAVRAVDIRSRVGPFSLPGSILLLNKM